MDDDDRALYATLLEDIRRTRVDIQTHLDNILQVMQGLQLYELISVSEMADALDHHRQFLSTMSVIEVAFKADPSEMAIWCAQRLSQLSTELGFYIAEVELFNALEVRQRLQARFPDLSVDGPHSA